MFKLLEMLCLIPTKLRIDGAFIWKRSLYVLLNKLGLY